jgi:small conductance mechanosensitive channel
MEWKDKLATYVVEHGPQLLGAVVLFMAGVLAARWVGGLLERWLGRKALEPPVRMLIVRLIKLLVIGFTTVVALGTCGVNVTALVAGIGVAGVGISLAMQGVLGNLVAGLTIIFTKPFRIGEYIELLNVQGQVQSIELFATTLLHPDLSRVIVPNRKIVGEVLHNYGTIRQADLTVNISYSSNLSEALELAREILANHARVLKNPAAAVGISSLGDSAITVAIRPWLALTDYGPVQAELYQIFLERCRASKIEIPRPQRDVRLLNSPGSAVLPLS